MIEVIFLGTGAAWGVPQVGCACPACREAERVPKWRRTRTSILISSDVNILIDATTDLRQQMLRENVCNIDALVITHGHPDHFLGLDEFRARTPERHTFHQIPFFVGESAWNVRVSSLFSYLTEGEAAPLCPPVFLEDKRNYRIGSWSLIPFRTLHGNPDRIGETFGIVLRRDDTKIVYTSDYLEIPDFDEKLLGQADILIVEATWLTKQEEESERQSGHVSFERAFHRYYKKLYPKRVALTHVSSEEAKTSRQWREIIHTIVADAPEIGKVYLSFDGLRIRI